MCSPGHVTFLQLVQLAVRYPLLFVEGHVIFSRLVVPSPLPDVSAPQSPAQFDPPSAELVVGLLEL